MACEWWYRRGGGGAGDDARTAVVVRRDGAGGGGAPQRPTRLRRGPGRSPLGRWRWRGTGPVAANSSGLCPRGGRGGVASLAVEGGGATAAPIGRTSPHPVRSLGPRPAPRPARPVAARPGRTTLSPRAGACGPAGPMAGASPPAMHGEDGGGAESLDSNCPRRIKLQYWIPWRNPLEVLWPNTRKLDLSGGGRRGHGAPPPRMDSRPVPVADTTPT